MLAVAFIEINMALPMAPTVFNIGVVIQLFLLEHKNLV
jgi:hypothetical protein